jgi:hypothetical protein
MHQDNDYTNLNNVELGQSSNHDINQPITTQANNTYTISKQTIVNLIKEISCPNQQIINNLEKTKQLWIMNLIVCFIEFVLLCVFLRKVNNGDILITWTIIDCMIHFYQCTWSHFRSHLTVMTNFTYDETETVNDYVIKCIRFWKFVLVNNILNFLHFIWTYIGFIWILGYNHALIHLERTVIAILCMNIIIHSITAIKFK